MSRNTHDRTDDHQGTLPATLVLTDGQVLEMYLRELWDRLTVLEGSRSPTFTVDAVLV